MVWRWIVTLTLRDKWWWPRKIFSEKMTLNPWWRHAMETLSKLLDLGEGKPPPTGRFLAQSDLIRHYPHVTLNTCSMSRWVLLLWYMYSPYILTHYDDVIMTMLASQITSLTVVYSIVYSGVNQRKHQSSASLAFVREIHRGPVNFPHKWPVARKMFPFDDVIMENGPGYGTCWQKSGHVSLTSPYLIIPAPVGTATAVVSNVDSALFQTIWRQV